MREGRVLTVSVSMPERVKARLDELAAANGVNRSAVVVDLIENSDRRVPEVRVGGRLFVPARGRRS